MLFLALVVIVSVGGGCEKVIPVVGCVLVWDSVESSDMVGWVVGFCDN